MKVSIMQPYFFPYAGHFALIAAVDEWVVFDVTQYTPKRWMNRNRMLHPVRGWQYITVPLSNSSIRIKTSDARILDLAGARTSILGKLGHYRKKAPHYERVVELVKEVFDTDDRSLVHLNTRGLAAVCRCLGIPFRYRICSEDPKLTLPKKLGAGEWALEISAALGAKRYLNPASGKDLFDAGAFTRRGIGLQFADPKPFVYDTGPYQYVPDLSILDTLMWVDAATVARAVRNGLRVAS